MHNFTIKNNRAGHFIVLAAVLLLMSITSWAFFFKEEPIKIEGESIFILIIIGGIGSVVLVMALKMMVQNPDVLVINENGFAYNPGGVSSGFMEWKNVAEIKFTEVRTTVGQLPGPVWERVLAIKFKDPSIYQEQYNPIVKGLMNLNKNMYDADIFFRLSTFGNKGDEVYSLMSRYWKEANHEVQ